MLRSLDVEKDLSIWTGILGARSQRLGRDAAYLRFDDAHHRIVLFPATRPGILSIEYAVENVDLLMRNSYVLWDLQVAVLHGPGHRPASEQLFLTFAGPSDVLFGFVAEGAAVEGQDAGRGSFPPAPRDFAVGAANARSASSTARRPVEVASARVGRLRQSLRCHSDLPATT